MSPNNYWMSEPVFMKLSLVSLGGVRLSPLGTSATVGLLYQPRMIHHDYAAVGKIRIGRGNGSTRRKSVPVPLCPPEIPHNLTWDWTRTAAVGSQRLTAWAMSRPLYETWYVYHAIWGRISGVLHKSLSSVIPTLQPPKLCCFIDLITHM
jgi:hypothetical protein